MHDKIKFKSITYRNTPNLTTACAMLHELAGKTITCTPRKIDKPLVLYGAGKLGRMAKEYLSRINIPILFVVDREPGLYKNDPFWSGIEIVAPEAVDKSYKKTSILAVSICTTPYTNLSATLSVQGWNDVVPFYDIAEAYRDVHPLSNGWFTGVLKEEDVIDIERVIRRWDDDISRAHHLQFLAWHSVREEWFFDTAPVTINDRYFIPQILSVLNDHETFLDVGAHHGDVTIKFLEQVDHHFKAIWVIEPDSDNIFILRKQFNERQLVGSINNINVLTCAVGESSGKRSFFEGLGYASQFCEFGPIMVNVKTIDELNITPTFIKVHLEGEELNALKGAISTIKNNRPIIAATSYHNHLGIWKFPGWLMNQLTDYTFLLRLHSWCGTGLVIYAIPKERLTN